MFDIRGIAAIPLTFGGLASFAKTQRQKVNTMALQLQHDGRKVS